MSAAAPRFAFFEWMSKHATEGERGKRGKVFAITQESGNFASPQNPSKRDTPKKRIY